MACARLRGFGLWLTPGKGRWPYGSGQLVGISEAAKRRRRMVRVGHVVAARPHREKTLYRLVHDFLAVPLDPGRD